MVAWAGYYRARDREVILGEKQQGQTPAVVWGRRGKEGMFASLETACSVDMLEDKGEMLNSFA